MAPRARLFAITGDAVARLSLSDGQVEEGELALEGSAAECVAVDPNDSNRAYVGTFHDGVYVTDDGGTSWRRVEEGLDRRYAWAAAIDYADPDLWYVAVSRGPFAAHGRGDAQARMWRSAGAGWAPLPAFGNGPELRRRPYAP